MSVAVAPRQAEHLDPEARLHALCDRGSFNPIRSTVTSSRMGAKARPGDGVIGGAGRVLGRPVYCFAQDPSFAGGSLGQSHADTIVRVLELAGRSKVPVVGFVSSGGARMQEGMAALAGYARIFRANIALSGIVPQISVICGTSAGGGSYSPALTDFTVMTSSSSMFLTGPGIVREVMGEDVSIADLGGPRVQGANGVAHFVADDDVSGATLARELLAYLPSYAGQALPIAPPTPPECDDPAETVPLEARRVYDIRDVIRAVVDGDSLLEFSPRWARNMVCALARVQGRPVGVVANQPRYLGGVIDVHASQKGAAFIRRCDAYGLPLVVLVDTPGFMPGTRQERLGVIRHGAALLHAFSAARVPKVTVVLRKAYGGAYITMNSKDLGADLVMAWPQAELGIMSARGAVSIVHRRELAAAEDRDAAHADLAARYTEEHLGAATAARDGYVDEIIEPCDTRRRLAWALGHLGEAPGSPGAIAW